MGKLNQISERRTQGTLLAPPFKTRKAGQGRQRYAEMLALLRSAICYLCLIGAVWDQPVLSVFPGARFGADRQTP